MSKKPSYNTFRDVARKCRGNITKIANAFGVMRITVYSWAAKDTKFKEVIDNYKGELLDECVEMGRIVALGIPEKDKDGNFVGWKERPDPSMIRYYLSTLGRKEGYADEQEETRTQALQSIEAPIIVFEK